MRWMSFCLLLLLTGCATKPSQPTATQADKIVVIKSTHAMTLYSKGKLLTTFQVALGRGPGDAKQREGDHETPEGTYTIDARNAHSRFHKALHVSYPNAQDHARAAKLGVAPGGDIMIHGIENGLGWIGSLQHRVDWTGGCIALTDAEVDEVWTRVPLGTPIEIKH